MMDLITLAPPDSGIELSQKRIVSLVFDCAASGDKLNSAPIRYQKIQVEPVQADAIGGMSYE
jgi:hypothetical protein